MSRRVPARSPVRASVALLAVRLAVPFALCGPLALPATGAQAASAAPLLVAQSATQSTPTSPATPQDRAKQIAAADTEIRVARDALDEARRRFEVGRKATTADRVNQLEGGGPHTDAYYLRVEYLKSEVTKAQERLDRAIDARKALGE